MIQRHVPSLRLAACLASALVLLASAAGAFEQNNRFRPGTFPARVETSVFSIPLEPDAVLVILPPGLMKEAARFEAELGAACGRRLEFRDEGTVAEAEVRGRHLIVAGNIQNNRWARRLYLRRLAFADAYFPGPGGAVITPAVSPWNRGKNIIVIGFSREADGPAAFAEFLRLLGREARSLGPLRALKTGLAFPKPPASIEKTLAAVTGEFVIFPPYREIILFGLAYHLTGDPAWADRFRAGCLALYERARKSGQWVPEPWTTLYFDLWRFFIVWGLLDRDPAFGPADRSLVEELLWNYWQVLDGDRNFPHFRDEVMVPGEIRQNHTTFLALDLFCAHRYYRDKYGLAGLDRLKAKYEPAMRAQVEAVHGNDDAGFGYWTNLVFGYIYLAPNHALLYRTLQGDEDYLAAPQLERFADLLVTVTDNRRDGASFGDVSGYDPRRPGLPRGMTEKYLELAAGQGNGEFHWVYDWLARDSGFELNNLFDGEYAIETEPAPPDRFLGVHPVALDDGGVRWAARRAEKPGFRPEPGRDYLDKLSFRRDFDADNEYLLLDGTSTFAHGHLDGNTVVRLTWKDRIWLFDLDYINRSPLYHNGLVIARDGVQEDPPPLTSLDLLADLPGTGLTRTASLDFNGADWRRNILWKKGEYFLFLDEVKAREAGDFRLDCRFRTRGETELGPAGLVVRQGGKEFRILGADGAPRRLSPEQESYWNTWNYPWGGKEIKVLEAVKALPLEPGDGWTFAHLMYASDGAPAAPFDFRRLDGSTYVIDGPDGPAVAGLDSSRLSGAGIATDAALFLVDGRTLRIAGATCLKAGGLSLQGPPDFSVELDLASGSGVLLAPPGSRGEPAVEGATLVPPDAPAAGEAGTGPGRFSLRVTGSLPDPREFLARSALQSRPPSPAPPPKKLQPVSVAAGREVALDLPWTACDADSPEGLLGNGRGEILKIEEGRARRLWQSPAGRPIGVVRAADLDADGRPEILAADDAENLFAVASDGLPLWSVKLTKYMGENANATDIAAAPTAAADGSPSVFVATNGFKVLAFDRKGRQAWESLVRYHRQTRIGAVEDGGRQFIVVGTVYSTPVNVFDGATGRALWHTWEQMGDEMCSTTDYCGLHLTDMIFLDADGDGSKEVVFGTLSNRVYALRLKDGSTVWEANVGDEVRCLRRLAGAGSKEGLIVAGTRSGDVIVLDPRGRRLARASLDSPVAGLEVFYRAGSGDPGILAAWDDGRAMVFDERMAVLGTYDLGRELKAVAPAAAAVVPPAFFLLTEKTLHPISYIDYPLRKSRVH